MDGYAAEIQEIQQPVNNTVETYVSDGTTSHIDTVEADAPTTVEFDAPDVLASMSFIAGSVATSLIGCEGGGDEHSEPGLTISPALSDEAGGSDGAAEHTAEGDVNTATFETAVNAEPYAGDGEVFVAAVPDVAEPTGEDVEPPSVPKLEAPAAERGPEHEPGPPESPEPVSTPAAAENEVDAPLQTRDAASVPPVINQDVVETVQEPKRSERFSPGVERAIAAMVRDAVARNASAAEQLPESSGAAEVQVETSDAAPAEAAAPVDVPEPAPPIVSEFVPDEVVPPPEVSIPLQPAPAAVAPSEASVTTAVQTVTIQGDGGIVGGVTGAPEEVWDIPDVASPDGSAIVPVNPAGEVTADGTVQSTETATEPIAVTVDDVIFTTSPPPRASLDATPAEPRGPISRKGPDRWTDGGVEYIEGQLVDSTDVQPTQARVTSAAADVPAAPMPRGSEGALIDDSPDVDTTPRSSSVEPQPQQQPAGPQSPESSAAADDTRNSFRPESDTLREGNKPIGQLPSKPPRVFRRRSRSAAEQVGSPLPSESAFTLDTPLWRRVALKAKTWAQSQVNGEEVQAVNRTGLKYQVIVRNPRTGAAQRMLVTAPGPRAAMMLAKIKYAASKR